MLLSKATYSAFRLYIYCMYACSLGIEPTTFTLLTQCSTTEPQDIPQELIYLYGSIRRTRLPVLVLRDGGERRVQAVDVKGHVAFVAQQLFVGILLHAAHVAVAHAAVLLQVVFADLALGSVRP